MPPEKNLAATEVEGWLAAFERALGAPSEAALVELFQPDSHWRDVLALTWDIDTLSGAAAIAAAVRNFAGTSCAKDFRLDTTRTPPRHVTRVGSATIEAIIAFETAHGRCNGVLRLAPATTNGTAAKAWTLVTVLDELDGHPERTGKARTDTKSFSRDFHGPNWLDLRKSSAAYVDREPAVVIVGAGQAGLSLAARLQLLGVDTLLLERNPRIGDNWRRRYHALTLHNQTHVNHLPYMPFPPGWPTYIPKDKLAGWFEAYAENMELNAWTSTEFIGGTWVESEKRWTVSLRRADGSQRELHPRHLVMAVGAVGAPSPPGIPSLSLFEGTVLHSSQYTDSEPWRGRRAIVLGTGTSGHDIAQDLHAAGAKVAIVQRSTSMVVNIEPSAQLPYTLYEEGPPLADCDLITVGTPFALLRRSYQMITEEGARIDKPLLDRLERRGFRLDFGDDGTGWQMKYLTRGGGYYFNVGCSDLIADGRIDLVQYADIAGFVAEGAQLRSGETVPADLIVLATGYKGQEHLVRHLLGPEVAERIGPVWGFGETQELRNMFKRTAQPGLWFIAGSFAQCRIYSKYLALQIKASEVGMLS